MGTFSNSPLVTHVNISPNQSGLRTAARIDRITPHCIVGQLSVEDIGSWFAQKAAQSSSNYGIGADGRVGMYVEEKDRSWCSSSGANDQRAITIECASDKTEPYWMNDKVIATLIDLMEDCCRRNGKTKLLWIPDKTRALTYTPESDEMLITVHRWFKNKSCPGDYLYGRLGELAETVTKRLSGETEAQTTDGPGATTMPTTEFEPFMVRVSTPSLNIRTGPGTNYEKTGNYTGRGSFTIVEIQNGAGSTAGWGKLKSGAGWISLDFATRI
jgi:hypothetical protein